jgi:23S rRNA G2445 N2-methylase RlmL
MAPETLSEWIKGLPPESTVLDPMCGSGVVIRQALLAGHHAVGVDMDPLAVLMSRVWAKHVDLAKAVDHARYVLREFRRLRYSSVSLPWIDGCDETQDFIRYWFAPKQRRDLRCLSPYYPDELLI